MADQVTGSDRVDQVSEGLNQQRREEALDRVRLAIGIGRPLTEVLAFSIGLMDDSATIEHLQRVLVIALGPDGLWGTVDYTVALLGDRDLQRVHELWNEYRQALDEPAYSSPAWQAAKEDNWALEEAFLHSAASSDSE